MRNAGFTVIDSPLRPYHLGRQLGRQPASLFLLGQCAGTLLLLLVVTASAIAVVAAVSVIVSTRDLVDDAATNASKSGQVQAPVDVKLSLPQP